MLQVVHLLLPSSARLFDMTLPLEPHTHVVPARAVEGTAPDAHAPPLRRLPRLGSPGRQRPRLAGGEHSKEEGHQRKHAEARTKELHGERDEGRQNGV